MTQPTVSRKEIAAGIGVSERTVVRHEASWGLDKCRSSATENPILFFRTKANRELLKRRIIDKPL